MKRPVTKDKVSPYCPYCGQEHPWDGGNGDEGDYVPETLGCGACGKTFRVEIATMPRYSTITMEEPMPPHWKAFE